MVTELVIDIGNSRAKLGLFHGGHLLRTGTLATGDTPTLVAWLGDLAPARIAIGSVGETGRWDGDLFGIAPLVVLRANGPSPLKSAYTTPMSLGIDRLANAVAVHALFPGRNALAIDIGTCITFDVVSAGGHYLGGAISPGMRMRSRAMTAFSARLPETVFDTPVPELGDSTQASLLAGVHHGIRHELEGWITTLRQQHAHLAVVLTGGDGLRFARALKSGIFADPSLTLRGLHALLHFAHPRNSDRPDRTGH